jgi:hypothetical protein
MPTNSHDSAAHSVEELESVLASVIMAMDEHDDLSFNELKTIRAVLENAINPWKDPVKQRPENSQNITVKIINMLENQEEYAIFSAVYSSFDGGYYSVCGDLEFQPHDFTYDDGVWEDEKHYEPRFTSTGNHYLMITGWIPNQPEDK